MRRSLAVVALALALAGHACSRDRPPPRSEAREPATQPGDAADREPAPRSMPKVIFELPDGDTARVTVEIVSTPAAIQRGLMYREHLPPNHGMLFIFPDEAIRTFWMKNTLISLDMIFISADREVVGVVERAEPKTTSPRRVDEPSQYVVEVNGGWARAHGIEAGARVRFQGVD